MTIGSFASAISGVAMEVPKVKLAVWVGIGQAIVVILYSLLKQLKAEARIRRRDGKVAGASIRQQVTELDRKIKAQVIALEEGIEPDLVSERIGELRDQKAALEDALAEMGAEQGEAEDEELERRLAAVPDLSESLRSASTQIKRQVFEAFDLQIHFDKREGRVEISATVSEEVAKALDGSEELFEEGSAVTLTNIAGARFVSRGDARILELIVA